MSGPSSGFLRRLLALTKKELRQLWRDKSNLALGLGLPVALILLFGYGISLDLKNAPIAVVLEDASPAAHDAISGLALSPYVSPFIVRDMPQAVGLMNEKRVSAILRVPSDFSVRLAAGDGRMQLLLRGTDAATARVIEGYVQGSLARFASNRLDRGGQEAARAGRVVVEQRLWFNEANTSTWYLVPGLIVLIMTLVGAFLTSLVVAREWERGTLEALFVTPVRPAEILLAKMIPYLLLGFAGLLLCVLAARYLFHVPLRGSVVLLLGASVLYLFVALGIGLLISSATKNQFLASQVALVSSFLPALMLSGFLFDLRNVPAVVSAIGHALPATHFLQLVRTLFLVGDVGSVVLFECGLLLVYAVVLIGAARAVTRKRLA